MKVNKLCALFVVLLSISLLKCCSLAAKLDAIEQAKEIKAQVLKGYADVKLEMMWERIASERAARRVK